MNVRGERAFGPAIPSSYSELKTMMRAGKGTALTPSQRAIARRTRPDGLGGCP